MLGFKRKRTNLHKKYDYPQMWQVLPRIIAALGTVEGWAIYSFMETAHGALNGQTPRRAVEQGRIDEVLGLAAAHSI